MKSVASAIKVLALFAGSRASWTVTAVSEATGLGKSQVSKLLSQYRDSGFLQQDVRSREYAVAPFAVALAGNFIKSSQLCREALGLMRRLVNEIDQTATLCILVGEEVMYLLSVEGPAFIDHSWRVGGWIPFHCTAAGKILVAGRGSDATDAMIARFGLTRFTPTTVCAPDALKQQLADVARSGLAVTHSEGTAGLGALAVPVLGEGQQVIAALGTVYPEHHVTPAQERHFAASLHKAAQQLSIRMGARVYPYGETRPQRANAIPDHR